jgi:methionine sulfoxide reductase catalytic subunit
MKRIDLSKIVPSEITPVAEYLNRRRFIAALSIGTLALRVPNVWSAFETGEILKSTSQSPYSTSEPVTPFEVATRETRFRELEKDIATNASGLITRPWQVTVEGECLKPQVFDIETLLTLAPIEDRIYRMRCTEGWSQVIPYQGYSLLHLLKQVQPTGNAKYVEFTSIYAPDKLRGQRDVDYIPWPYFEGLRIDEAMHPLTIVALGAYGQLLPKPLGAPLAIRVPWKYGMKSPKAVVRIRLVEKQPQTVWAKHYPQYHTFWSNVNPNTARGFWSSQARERRSGDFLKRPTLPFNGYAEHVASLYQEMNPKDTY